ncbi:MAG: hypothetical protein RL684_1015 [Pseudomonadota bacterium]|jgi:undecaprenyl-diphosphatase
MNRAQAVLARFDLAEYRLCRGLNSIVSQRALRTLFQAASRAGDGVFWYAMLVVLPLVYGLPALRASLAMAATGLLGVGLYKALKHTLVRERPFIRHAGITLAMPPLDRYSFPSGHTLHAACFSWQAIAHYPALAWLLVPVASLIAASRVVLGLHYPSDVLAGALLGIGLAQLGLALG